MIGSGNAAEGELRPQLLDRFGLSVDVRTMADVADRATMVRDRLAYETNPTAFAAACEAEQAELRGKLVTAAAALKAVVMPPDIRLHISEMCSLLGIDGIRGDITVNRAARALVALEARGAVTADDVKRVAGMCLNHRLRKDVLDEIDTGTKVALAWRRVTNPRAAAADAEAKAAAAAAAEAAAAANKKAGSWGGLPGAAGGGGAAKPGAWGGLPGR